MTQKNSEFFLCPQYLTSLPTFHINIRFILLKYNFDYVTSLLKKNNFFSIETFLLINHEGMIEYHHFAVLNEIMYVGVDHQPSIIRLEAEREFNHESFRLTILEPPDQF